MKALNIAALILILMGALNWGLVGLFRFDLVATLLGGSDAPATRILYVLMGLAGLYGLSFLMHLRHLETDMHRPARAPGSG